MQTAINVITNVGFCLKIIKSKTLIASITVAVSGTTITGAQSARFNSKNKNNIQFSILYTINNKFYLPPKLSTSFEYP